MATGLVTLMLTGAGMSMEMEMTMGGKGPQVVVVLSCDCNGPNGCRPAAAARPPGLRICLLASMPDQTVDDCTGIEGLFV